VALFPLADPLTIARGLEPMRVAVTPVIFGSTPGNIMTGLTTPPPPPAPPINVVLSRTASGRDLFNPNMFSLVGGGGGYGGMTTPGTTLGAANSARDLIVQFGYDYCVQRLGRAVCDLGRQLVNALTGGNATGMPMGGGIPMNGGGMMALAADCPSGYMKVGTQCVRYSAMLPGGMPFTTAPGNYGIPAAAPTAVTTTRLRCPRGLILGDDNLCYPKGALPRRLRKWKPDPRPLVGASDMKALRKINTITKRVKKAAGVAGLSARKRGSDRHGKGCACVLCSGKRK